MTRVLVVGAGLAGLSCALRLADDGVPVTVVSTGVGSLQLGGATIDVLGYAPGRVTRPLEAFPSLAADHPYALLGRDRVTAATRWLVDRLPALDLRGAADENLLLASARVVPKRLLDTGYVFRSPELETTLRRLLGREVNNPP